MIHALELVPIEVAPRNELLTVLARNRDHLAAVKVTLEILTSYRSGVASGTRNWDFSALKLVLFDKVARVLEKAPVVSYTLNLLKLAHLHVIFIKRVSNAFLTSSLFVATEENKFG